MRTIEYTFTASGTSFFPAKENILKAKSEAERRAQENTQPRIQVFLVPDEENRYDPHAIRIMYNSLLYGPLFLGHVPARRFCPKCNSFQEHNPRTCNIGFPTYVKDGMKPVTNCPDCSAELTKPMTEVFWPLVNSEASDIEAYAVFIGGTTEKENVGLLLYVKVRYETE
jgi:hypothetical protein